MRGCGPNEKIFANCGIDGKKKVKKLSQFFDPTSTYEKQTHWDGYILLVKHNARVLLTGNSISVLIFYPMVKFIVE